MKKYITWVYFSDMSLRLLQFLHNYFDHLTYKIIYSVKMFKLKSFSRFNSFRKTVFFIYGNILKKPKQQFYIVYCNISVQYPNTFHL